MGMIEENMRLGSFEFFVMNNSLRNWRMRYQEFPLLRKMIMQQRIELQNPTIVDMGCGSGYSTFLLQKNFKPGKIHAFDLMPEQIALARRRNLGIDFRVADATSMPVESTSCNAVFDLGILHHIPAWRQVLTEVQRILFPGGILFIEEPHKLFEWYELEQGIAEAGLAILDRRQWYGGFFRFFLCKKDIHPL
jgi:ubiquinone/menaquinone biosynthesis C-methylase UbiE